MIRGAKLANYIRPILGWKWVQDALKARIDKTVSGPDESARARMPTYVWGEVRNASGETRTARIKTDNGYSLTITGSLAMADNLMRNTPEGGAYTPSKLAGADIVTQLPGSGEIVIR